MIWTAFYLLAAILGFWIGFLYGAKKESKRRDETYRRMYTMMRSGGKE